MIILLICILILLFFGYKDDYKRDSIAFISNWSMILSTLLIVGISTSRDLSYSTFLISFTITTSLIKYIEKEYRKKKIVD